MRILTVGAGAVGGYFGARLARAGQDVTFLVRPERAAALRTRGLRVTGLGQELTVTPALETADTLRGTYDLVLLSVKSTALEQSVRDLAPAVGPGTAILPLLNGMAHLDVLAARFGERAVLGGVAKVVTTLDAHGDIVRMAPVSVVLTGEADRGASARVTAVREALTAAGIDSPDVPDIVAAMWHKWVFIATLAAVTCLMRGSVGEVNAVPGGTELGLAVLAEAASVAAAAGHPVPDAELDATARTVSAAGSPLTPSMYRDLLAGSPAARGRGPSAGPAAVRRAELEGARAARAGPGSHRRPRAQKGASMPPDRPGDDTDGPVWSEPGSLLENVAVAVFGIDGDDRVCYWGPGARTLFGHEAAEALGRPAGDLFPGPAPEPGPGTAAGDAAGEAAGDAPADAASRLGERARTLGYWRVRLPARHRDGSVFDCGVRVFPVTGPSGASVVMGLASRGSELDRVKTNLAFLDALFETCPIGLVMLDQDLRYVHLNQALADMDGIPLEGHLGRRMTDVMITSDDGAYQRMLRAVADEGRTVIGALVGLRTPGFPDRDQVRSVSFFPLSGAGDTRRGLGGLLLDVTDREQAIVEATAARQRLALLDRAAARIGTTLDLSVTARELVDVAVPDFCDGAVVELVEWMDESAPFDPDLPLRTRRIASGTTLAPPAAELLTGLERVTYPPGSSIHHMLSTGRPLWVPVDEDFATRTVAHQERARLLLDSGLSCILIAPLIARGTVQGIAMFGRSAPRPGFSEEDLSLAGELSSRAALCLDNARLYNRVQDIALTLQRALLPSAPAAGPWVDIAHRYLPGSRVTEVGGDWYDVIALPGDRVALVVGDVMGHGVPAAAAMGRLRITAKTLARHTLDPEALLAELDLCAQEAGIELATCLYLLYDPRTGRARIASAGHPPPLVRHPDGTVHTVGDVLGVPLGVGGVAFASTEVRIPEGAVVALYTDGLVETRGQDIEAGIEALRAQLRGPMGSLEEAADRILANLLPDPATDDTVLVLARVRRAGPPGSGPAPEPQWGEETRPP